MRLNLKTFLWVLAGLALSGASVRAITMGSSTNRFRTIPERNVFRLKEPTQEQAVTNPPVRPLPKLILTGITTILGNKRVLMKELPVAGGPEQGKEIPLMLTEGQREADVEVLEIDERAGRVRVNNSGTPMMLSFEKDGAKLPTSPAPPALPAAAPGVQPAAAAAGIPAPAMAAPAAASPAPANAVVQPGLHALPSRTPRLPVAAPGTAAASAPPAVQDQSDLTPEQQSLLQELQRELNQTNGNVPPSPATSPANAGTSAGRLSPPASPSGRPTPLLPQ
jgi:hypothetical protein